MSKNRTIFLAKNRYIAGNRKEGAVGEWKTDFLLADFE